MRAGLRSSVDVAFHTEPIALERMASKKTIQNMQSGAMNPDTEKSLAEKSLLTADERKTKKPTFAPPPPPPPPTAADPGSDEQRKLREKKEFGPPKTETNAGGGDATATP